MSLKEERKRKPTRRVTYVIPREEYDRLREFASKEGILTMTGKENMSATTRTLVRKGMEVYLGEQSE